MVTPTPSEFLDVVRTTRLVAIIRGTSGTAAVATARVLFDSGVSVVEVALTTPDALAAIKTIAACAPDGAYVGAGTVLTVSDLDEAVAAGASFIVTPGLTESVTAAVARQIPVLAGAFTPTEAIAAHTAGATAVKLFPASAGGPEYLRALRDPLPDVPFIPVGGVGLAEAEAFFRAGASAIGVGSPLVGGAASGGDLSALADRAAAFVELARRVGI